MLRMPTLVLHRRDNPGGTSSPPKGGEPDCPTAGFVELPGTENDIFLGDTAPALRGDRTVPRRTWGRGRARPGFVYGAIYRHGRFNGGTHDTWR